MDMGKKDGKEEEKEEQFVHADVEFIGYADPSAEETDPDHREAKSHLRSSKERERRVDAFFDFLDNERRLQRVREREKVLSDLKIALERERREECSE
jgi:hypothetical protein